MADHQQRLKAGDMMDNPLWHNGNHLDVQSANLAPLPVSTSAVPIDQRQNAPEKNNFSSVVTSQQLIFLLFQDLKMNRPMEIWD